jgi:polysaccharide biosynthesis/export protein
MPGTQDSCSSTRRRRPVLLVPGGTERAAPSGSGCARIVQLTAAPRGARTEPRLRLTAALTILLGCVASGCTALSVGVSDPVPVTKLVQLSRPYRSVGYRLMPGDQLTMRAYYNPQLDEDIQVRPDGLISLSLLGDIPAAGKTASELSADITKAYSQYFVKPTAVVIVREFTGYRVFTSGELRTPGQLNLLTGAQTVLESIAASGGLTEDGTLTSVILIRRLPSQAKPMVAELNLADALSGDDPSQDVTLMPNDFVYVPRSGMADFNAAMQQYLFRNLNLSTSISAAYGLGTLGDGDVP